MIFSHTAGSAWCGFADEPHNDAAQAVDFAVASSWFMVVVLVRLLSEIIGGDIEGSVAA
ncbi:hypothetical protein AM571_PB00260 (plasmid) [Rhizobium etli 8C-3]|uniref:Uncharacterized protein n=2 Tax=Rhizobium TaxID=379 RepID=A0A1L5PBS9_RHIET|nr:MULTISPECIES: hypothetical protein [Rhizobium]EGE56321.1 hypothetical protein RHECNPAF_715005 [Rhizobium etli CNPAF512]APO77545.1 hypothetical protein AM571_PB00260 [Rhizobium etli 8C-3]MBB4332460.1 hypothetical protein [Rhizobium leguminosarum]MBB4357445.1 hypothetical protein [Rhizobium leguminosarum]MBB4510236.1 hypothetical protein [Rhizobium leguminosarum]